MICINSSPECTEFKQKISKKYNLTKIYNSNIYVYTLIKNVYLFCSHVFRIPLNNCVFLFINFTFVKVLIYFYFHILLVFTLKRNYIRFFENATICSCMQSSQCEHVFCNLEVIRPF